MSKVAVVGCGGWGKNLVRNFYELGALGLVCDISERAVGLTQQMIPSAKVTTSFEQVLNSDCQGVVIATPSPTHATLTLRALAAGKDVMVEKPMALTVSGGAACVAAAQQQERILMVGHVLEYHPAIDRIRGLKSSLGPLRYLWSSRLNSGRVRDEEDVLWSFTPHDVAVALSLVGTMPSSVSVSGYAVHVREYGKCQTGYDVALLQMEWPGVHATVHASWVHPFKEQRLVVAGDRAALVLDDVNKRLTLHNVALLDRPPWLYAGKDEELIDFSDEEPLKLEALEFMDAMRTRTTPLTDGRSGLRVLQVLENASRRANG